jgi:hypothetical protein
MPLAGYTPEATDFRIIPLDDTQNLPVISLQGFMLPVRGVSFPTEQRIKTTYYPGNAQASQTVLGPILPNTTIVGRWMDISRNVADGEPRTVVRQIEYLVQHAVPVEVQWGGRNFGASSNIDDDPAIVRRGLIKKIDPKYNRLEDIEWSIEFEWAGGDVQSQSPTLSSDVVDQGGAFVDFSDMMGTTVDATQSWMETAWKHLNDGANELLAVSDALDYLQNRLLDAISVVDGASDLLQSLAELPANIGNRVRGVADRAVLACANGRAAVDAFCGTWELVSRGLPQAATPGSINNPLRVEARRALLAMMPTDDPLDHLDKQTALHDVIGQWDTTAALAARRSAAVQSQTLPDVIAIERPPAGSDLRDLAVRYYGDSSLWIVIAAYPANNLDSSEVPATPTGPSDIGAPPIYIPRLTSASTALAALWGEETTP